MNEILKQFGGVQKIVTYITWIVIAIVVYFAIKKAYLWWVRRNAGEQSVDKNQLDEHKNYDSFAKAVNDAFNYPWYQPHFNGSEMNDVAGTLLSLNNDELKEVNNRYLKLYGQGEQTLYQAIGDPTCISCDNVAAILERLKSLAIV